MAQRFPERYPEEKSGKKLEEGEVEGGGEEERKSSSRFGTSPLERRKQGKRGRRGRGLAVA